MAGFRTIELSDPGISAEGLRFVTVKSAALGGRADLCVWVAPGIEPGATAPLIVLMHGVYGSHWAWALKGGAHLCAARLVAEGTLPPVVLAMPSDGLWGDGSGYVPHRDHDFERWIIDEVPLAAAEATGARGAGSPLLLAGLSMGGFAALRLAGKYPDRVTAAAAHSAVTHAAALDALIAESREDWSTRPEDISVEAALTGAQTPLPPLRFDCGRDDPYLADNRALHLALDRAGIPHRYREAEGGHDWTYWSREIEPTLRFFGSVLTDAAKEKPGGDQ